LSGDTPHPHPCVGATAALDEVARGRVRLQAAVQRAFADRHMPVGIEMLFEDGSRRILSPGEAAFFTWRKIERMWLCFIGFLRAAEFVPPHARPDNELDVRASTTLHVDDEAVRRWREANAKQIQVDPLTIYVLFTYSRVLDAFLGMGRCGGTCGEANPPCVQADAYGAVGRRRV